ncbi:putative FKBP-type peptidyl-prolyl isomerase [Baffinella frigidus]|nr:putative FKBP-type peptidyl-prolyl isomerase [Cryptophyta sp. CCMP2293]
MGLVDREVITEGDGKTFPQSGDTLTVHYEGTLARGGTKFDSSYDRGSPLQFQIGQGQVIKGWDQGMMDMSLGEKATLTIQPFFAYGPQGSPPDIPPMSTLIFVVELLGINDVKA